MFPARALLCLQVVFGALCSVAACTDTAVVGVNLERVDSGTSSAHGHCDPACDRDERCHPKLHICVRCVGDDDCASDRDGPFCDAMRLECVHCRSAADCSMEAPRCDDGTCRTCEDSPNCVGDHCAHADEACRFDNHGPGAPGSGSGGNGGWPR